MFNPDGVDWRSDVYIKLDKEQHGRPKGSIIHQQVTETSSRLGVNIRFPEMSPSALALNIAFKNCYKASLLRRIFLLQGRAPHYFIAPEHQTALFDYYEYCMQTVVFSINAVESFMNKIITDGKFKKLNARIRGTKKDYSKEHILKFLSLAEKGKIVLPKLLDVRKPCINDGMFN